MAGSWPGVLASGLLTSSLLTSSLLTSSLLTSSLLAAGLFLGLGMPSPGLAATPDDAQRRSAADRPSAPLALGGPDAAFESLRKSGVADDRGAPESALTLGAEAGFRFFGVAEGLPDPWATALLRDRQGFLWVGTENGLARFDGSRFEIFHHHAHDPQSLLSDRIRVLFETRSGELWVGTAAGACRFVPDQLGFACFGSGSEADSSADSTGASASPAFQPGREVTAITEDQAGYLWVATATGLERRRPGGKRFEQVSSTVSSTGAWPAGRILALVADGNRLWVGTERGLVLREPDGLLRHYRPLDPSPAALAKEPSPSADDEAPALSLRGSEVRVLRLDSFGRLWLVTEAGVSRLDDPKLGHFYHLEHPLVAAGAVDLALDAQHVWISLGENGLVRHELERGSWSRLRAPRGLGSAAGGVGALVLDSEHLLWAAVPGLGIALRHPAASAFRLLGQTIDPGSGRGRIGALRVDSAGMLWVGRDGGLDRLDFEGRVRRYQPWPPSAAPVRVRAVLEESPHGRLLLGTESRGIWAFDPASGRVEPWWPMGPSPSEPQSIVALADDGQDRWVATGGGLWRCPRDGEPEAIAIRDFDPSGSEPESGARPHMTDLWADHDGTWATTADGSGLLSLPGNASVATLERPPRAGADRLRMHALRRAEDGKLWIATDEGLLTYDPSRSAFQDRPSRIDLVDERLAGLAFDDGGRIWIAGAEGIRLVSTADRRVVPLAPMPLASGLDFTHSRLETRRGKVYLSLGSGLLEVDPSALPSPAPPRAPALVGLELGGERLGTGNPGPEGERESGRRASPGVGSSAAHSSSAAAEHSTSVRAAPSLDLLHLGPGHGPVTFEVEGRDLARATDQAYRYRLEGLHEDWRLTEPGRRSIEYAELAPGDYVLEVWTTDGLGRESAYPLRLPIRVSPAWWLSPLAFLAYAVGALVLGLGLLVTTRARYRRSRALDSSLQEAQAQKLESMSTLAGGIAHDFNNLLVGIYGHTELARLEKDDPEAVAMHLAEIENVSSRAAELARQMRVYSGQGKFVVEPLDLSVLVGGVAETVRPGLAEGVRLLVEIEPNLPPIEGDEGQLRQVLGSLIQNAAESLAGSEGYIVLATGLLRCDKAFVGSGQIDDTLPPGDYVFLTVDDTGSGIEAANMPKIFDPFFSTKSPGRGLGLAASQGIVRGHGGALQVSSTAGRGSTFRVLFPVVSKAETSSVIERPPSSEMVLVGGSRGLVLVVDDEKTVRLVAAEYLERLGFRALQATDGRQAVEIFTREHQHLTLVLLDLNMPGMDGAQAFREMKALDSRVPIVLSSGFTEEDAVQRFGASQPEGFIEKPYRLAQLDACVRGVVGSTSVH